MKRKQPDSASTVIVQHVSAEPHSVKLTRGLSGGTSIEVKVYSADERDAAERALRLYLKIQRDLAKAFLEKNAKPFNTS